MSAQRTAVVLQFPTALAKYSRAELAPLVDLRLSNKPFESREQAEIIVRRELAKAQASWAKP